MTLPYGRVTASADLCDKAFEIVAMRYSRGDALSDVREDVNNLLSMHEQLKRYCDALPNDEQKKRIIYERLSYDNYNDFVSWQSLAACFEMGETHIKRVLELIGNAGKDALLDRLAVKLGDHDRSVAQALIFPKQYASLLQVMNATTDEQPVLMGNFLDGWYKSNKSVAAWYDNHKGEDTGYVGYWCFEAALVVKLFNIDDSSFRSHVYYPADLVHVS